MGRTSGGIHGTPVYLVDRLQSRTGLGSPSLDSESSGRERVSEGTTRGGLAGRGTEKGREGTRVSVSVVSKESYSK